MKLNIVACIVVVGLLFGCGKRITDEPPPKGCVSIVFVVDKSLGGVQLDEVENFARGLRGEKPYPEVSFEMGKGVSGSTAFRVTRKLGVDVDALRSESEAWLTRKYPGKVSLEVIK